MPTKPKYSDKQLYILHAWKKTLKSRMEEIELLLFRAKRGDNMYRLWEQYDNLMRGMAYDWCKWEKIMMSDHDDKQVEILKEHRGDEVRQFLEYFDVES